MSKTIIEDFIGECNAGLVKEKLEHALSDAALAQLLHGAGNKKAKVGVEFSFQQIGDNDQVQVSAKIATTIPTKRGKKAEEDVTDTAFFVGKGGVLSINPPKEEASGQYQLDQQQDGAPTNIRQIQ